MIRTPFDLALNTITIKYASINEKIEMIKEAGFNCIELWSNEIQELISIDGNLNSFKELLNQHQMEILFVCPAPSYYPWHYDLTLLLLNDFKELFERSQALGASGIVMPIIGNIGTIPETISNTQKLCDIAASYNLVLGLEFIGSNRKLNTLESVLSVIEKVNRFNCKLVIDLFHVYRGNSNIKAIRRIDPERIMVVHLDDSMSIPISNLIGTKHRVFPGDGIIPIMNWIKLIKETGYHGPFSVEVFNEDYWQRNTKEVCIEAFQKTTAFLK
ncbi:sugar phosphate isomerase/epimerase family protein [Ammoniphilus resinae]|uniref:2-keto-myo-inositol isomerase n=1 Tax=Ammoniphilus resinae TaxID=861532 RepID=A0ABS4GSL9_9BACL|nr:sugar phosphate isomerase/epimerase family protein [Ammoniphilus resinae]MBP1933274.1 2-keto-myo-inositol isomerase [Ammoniphilus resinae]